MTSWDESIPREVFNDEQGCANIKGSTGETHTVELITPGARSGPRSESAIQKTLPSSSLMEESVDDEEKASEEKAETSQSHVNVAQNPPYLASKSLQATRFGLRKDKTTGKQTQDELNNAQTFPVYDYTKKYPPDKRYEELHDDARVWLMYNDEAAIFDSEMVGEAADSLDILLVFAGLFAGVLSTFVAQTSQSLSPDNSAIAVSLLVELVAVQRAALTGDSLSDIAAANITPAIEQTSVWVNALWFTSLALSLASALLAVLSKQWLRQYVSFISGTPRERALIRQFRYDGMEKWAVRTIVGLLPTFLHLALGLFLAGLIVFLAPLQRGIAVSVGTISGALLFVYVSSIIIAVVHVQSPYRTTFSDIISTSLRWNFLKIYPTFQVYFSLPDIQVAPTARAAEHELAVCLEEHTGAVQACNALLWLRNSTGSVSAKTLIMESLSAFPHNFFDGNAQQAVFTRLSNGCGPDIHAVYLWQKNFPHNSVGAWERMYRILCFASRGPLLRPPTSSLEADAGLLLAYNACVPSHNPRGNWSTRGPENKVKAIPGLFSDSTSYILDGLLLNFDGSRVSNVSTSKALGYASPVVWSSLVAKEEWLSVLSPRDLDEWPPHVDLRDYLDLMISAMPHLPIRPSVFQSPVDILSFMHPIFSNLGWHVHMPGKVVLHDSVKPLCSWIPGNFLPSDEEDFDPPPLDEDEVWEPAVYPQEWPPLPAPTWADAWRAAEVKYVSQDAQEDVKEPQVAGNASVGRVGRIRELVRERLYGGSVSENEESGIV